MIWKEVLKKDKDDMRVGTVYPSDRSGKKIMMLTHEGKKIHAGAKGYGNYKKKGKNRGGRGMAMMQRADTNGDQMVSKAEFTAAALARFDKADANGDGVVTKEERQAARAAHREQRNKRGG